MRIAIASRISFCLTLTCMLSVWQPCALALDPALDVSQYGHTAWKIRDGFSKSEINVFAQTPDGYLWLGTYFGLLRFDGVRNIPWQAPAGMSLPDDRIRALLAAHDGTLWIGTVRGLASWNGSKLVTYPRFDGTLINALAEDREGTVWVGARTQSVGLLCAIRGASTECYGEDGSLGASINSLYEDSEGALWVAGGNRLWRWKPGSPIPYWLPGPVSSLNAVSETASGEILIVTVEGIRQLVDGKVETFPLPPVPWPLRPNKLFRDRDGAFWIAVRDSGLIHAHQGRIDVFARSDGLSGDLVDTVFEDREGNVWVATLDGVDRFRVLAASTYSMGQGASGPAQSVVADEDGSVWFSTASSLNRWHDGRVGAYRARPAPSSADGAVGTARRARVEEIVAAGLPEQAAASLFRDRRGRIWLGSQSGLGYLENGRFVAVDGVPGGYIDGIAEDDDGNLWIAHRDAGLLRLRADRKVQQIPWTTIGQSGSPYCLAVDAVSAGLWLGFFSGGIVQVVDGQVRASYSGRDGLGKGRVNHLRVGADGTVWAATDGGLSRLKAGRIATFDGKGGLPCDAVDSTIEDDEGSTWLYTVCGLVRIARSELDTWFTAVEQGKPPQRIPALVLDTSDGVRGGTLLGTFSPHIAKARDGKLWFTTFDGVMVVDPRNLHVNKLPPPVHVEQIVADRKTYEAYSQLRLPPLVRDLQIDYTALSLVATEKVLFRYKLEGRDGDWQDAGNRRQAFYTDLDPGNYRFLVIASNNSGVWNEEGASLDFSIAPAYWQTNWFRALCVAAFIALLWALYRLRLSQIAQGFNARLEERVGERTRIARDLHDTLLQSFQGLLLRFQTVYELLPTRPTDAKKILASAIDQTAQAINEGRDAVQGLRASTIETNDLAVAITRLGEELAAEAGGQTSAGMRVEVEGEPRTLQPIVRDEVYRIASEALRNAFRHAEAKQIEVELRYDGRQLRLRIRDDGKGIDRKYLSAEGRAGHFGLHGMRERAKLMGGKLTIWTAPGSGTEIELSVPAAHAYVASAAPGRSWRAKKFSGKSAKVES